MLDGCDRFPKLFSTHAAGPQGDGPGPRFFRRYGAFAARALDGAASLPEGGVTLRGGRTRDITDGMRAVGGSGLGLYAIPTPRDHARKPAHGRPIAPREIR